MAARKTTKCLVVGAGPVGALAAIYAAKRGWDVEVYDLRGDLRLASTTPLNFTKSINLALSERGVNAMRVSGADGLLETVLDDTIPMYGRMIHGEDGKGASTEESQQYDVHGRFQRAVDRGSLNKTLLDQLERLPNVKLLFHRKLTGADFQKQKAWFELRDPAIQDKNRAREVEVDFDIMLGCDGAHSAVRYHLMKFVRMNYTQDYIDTLWCEFTIPPNDADSGSRLPNTTSATPSAKDGFRTSPNHLHIWPSSDKMFIAIPSTDKTFTCTLFAPSETFTSLAKNPDQVEPFFHTNFPGAADLVGPDLTNQFTSNPHLPLISIKCSPHTFSSTAVILGDAAHAMVPFYGQGMNAGLEDVRVLFSHLDAYDSSTAAGREAALQAYTTQRIPDAHAINDLAMGNYWEMHAGVQSRMYLLRKKVEEWLSDSFPGRGWATQYSRVSFSNERYSDVVKRVKEQGMILQRWMAGAGLLGVGTVGWMVWLLVARSRIEGRVGRTGFMAPLREAVKQLTDR